MKSKPEVKASLSASDVGLDKTSAMTEEAEGSDAASLEGKRVAIVGSGITGLASAWLLHRSGTHVTLYEREPQCGGHTLTDDSPGYQVDLGFQVFNLTTYPNLVGLLEALEVDTEPSDMSFALSIDGGALEWGSHGLDSIFAQRRNLLSPSFWLMIWDVLKFGRQAPQALRPEQASKHADMCMGEYLRKNRYSSAFIQNYLLPMCAAVWSVPNEKVLAFPVTLLIRFWQNHHLLDVMQRPVWRVVSGRSREYVKRILAELPEVRTGCPVARVVPAAGPDQKVTVHTEAGQEDQYDAVILATHSDISKVLLEKAAPRGVVEVLSAIPYNYNDVYLHTDASLMPHIRATWASWNFLGRSQSSADAAVCCTYWINRLQRLPAHAPDTFVTLNPLHPPAAEKTIRRLQMSHPQFSFESQQAQQRLEAVQGLGQVYYAGAWCGYGFHEDGLKAGMAAAQALGAQIPWTPISTSPKISLADRFFMGMFDKFARTAIRKGHLRFILPNGEELEYGSRAEVGDAEAEGDNWQGRPALTATVRLLSCAFFRKVITRHDTGMGESYMDGDYEVSNLGSLLAVATANATSIESNRGMLGWLNWAGDRLLHLAHCTRSNTRIGSRKNIEEHYDAGNDMYSLFLDDTMTYSGGVHRKGDSLQQAQINKLDALIARADINGDHHVLEIGCGWGSMAIRCVQRTGCRVTGITLSKEQLAEAKLRVKQAGLDDRIKLLLCDYRDCPTAGTFDRVVSCEMIEAVGHEHLVSFFQCVGRQLKQGGVAVIQAITEPEERYEAYCQSSDFIREHVFPGGHLPSMGAMVDAAGGTGLLVHDVADIGPGGLRFTAANDHLGSLTAANADTGAIGAAIPPDRLLQRSVADYAITLRAWRTAWEARRAEALKLGYSQGFWRKYRFYFAYCEAAFDAKYIHNYQITWKKDGPVQAPPAEPAGNSGHSVTSMLVHGDRTRPADPVTQTLLAVYFFLAGIVVSQRPMLLAMPMASAACILLLGATAWASQLLVPAYRCMTDTQRAWWCTDMVHLLYSTGTCLGAGVYVLRQPQCLNISWQPQPQQQAVADAFVCISAGFFGFQLWTLVHHRLAHRAYSVLLHFTILLFLFSSAAYKSQGTPLLTATLVSELPTLFYLVGRLRDIVGRPSSSVWSRRWHTLELWTLLVFSLMPHAAVAAAVAANPDAFTIKRYWGLALGGSVYVNLVNVKRAYSALSNRSDKLHHA